MHCQLQARTKRAEQSLPAYQTQKQRTVRGPNFWPGARCRAGESAGWGRSCHSDGSRRWFNSMPANACEEAKPQLRHAHHHSHRPLISSAPPTWRQLRKAAQPAAHDASQQQRLAVRGGQFLFMMQQGVEALSQPHLARQQPAYRRKKMQAEALAPPHGAAGCRSTRPAASGPAAVCTLHDNAAASLLRAKHGCLHLHNTAATATAAS